MKVTTIGKAESEKLPLLWSRHRALRFIHLEFELLRDESRDAFHHPLTRARCERRCCYRPCSEHSDILGAPTHGRVRRARSWTAVEKVDTFWPKSPSGKAFKTRARLRKSTSVTRQVGTSYNKAVRARQNGAVFELCPLTFNYQFGFTHGFLRGRCPYRSGRSAVA